MSLRYCPADRTHKVDAGDKFCEECGTSVELLKCEKGHERFTKNAKFCWSCGVRLEPLAKDENIVTEDLIGFRKGEDPF
jgi:hypothetical protein